MCDLPKFGTWQIFLDKEIDAKKALQNVKSDGSLKNTFEDVLCQWRLQHAKWIDEYFVKTTKFVSMKNDLRAKQHREEGNGHFKTKNYKEAAECYSQCILHACHNDTGNTSTCTSSGDLALGYGNRSAALLYLKLYRECLRDISECLKKAYPLRLQCKVYLRQATCYWHVSDNVRARDALEKAKEALQYVESSKRGFSEKEIHALAEKISQLSSNESFQPDTVEQTIVKTPHSVLVQASSVLDLRFSEAQGRFLVAGETIEPGDVIITEKPYAAVLLPRHYDDHCNHCFDRLKLSLFYPCSRCNTVRYCSPSCQSSAWHAYHRIECVYQDLLHSIGIAHLGLRVVLTAGLKGLLSIQDKLESGDRTCDGREAERSTDGIAGVTEAGVYARNYRSVYELLPHTGRMPLEDLLQYALTACLLLRVLEEGGFFHDLGNISSSTVENPQNITDTEPKCSEEKLPEGEAMCADFKNNVSIASSDASLGSAKDDTAKTHVSEHCENGAGSRPFDVTCQSGSCTHVRPCCDENCSGCATELEASEELEDLRLRMGYGIEKGDMRRCDLDTTEVKLYIGALLLRHICQLVCNAHAITELQTSRVDDNSLVDTETQERIATAIYPTASLMNHSCDPTIMSSFDKDRLIVRVVRRVEPGQEIFNCYGPHHKRMSYGERQECLQSQYFFTCQCEPCTSDCKQALYEALRCPHCSGPLPGDPDDPVQTCMECGKVTDVAQTGICRRLQEVQEKFTEALDVIEHGGNISEAVSKLEEVVRQREKYLYKLSRGLGEAHNALARAHSGLGNFSEAARHLLRSIDVTRAIHGDSSIELAHELHTCAEVLYHAQDFSRCLKTGGEALHIMRVYYGESHVRVQELAQLLLVVKEHLRA